MATATEEAAIRAAAIEQRSRAVAIRGEGVVRELWYFVRLERAGWSGRVR